jgi:putative flippase GtrA
MIPRLITQFIDFFYPLFSRIFDRQTFRYAACGGANTLLDILLYFYIFQFVLDKQDLHTPFVTISAPIASFLLAFLITFPSGFFLMRYVVFVNSHLRGRVQLLRYFAVVLFSLLLNYVFIKFFIDILHFYPTMAKITTSVVVIAFSYLSQRYFSFKAK